MPNVTLCICTCQRPRGLARLLDEVARLDWGEQLEIVVIDNDPAQEGIDECRRRAGRYRWPLRFDFEPRRGISFARNRAISLALEHTPDFIAMLDDDEWPAPNWLNELLAVQARTGADVIGAPVLPVFDEVKPDWVIHIDDCYGANLPVADGERCMLYACGNFIARAACFKALAPDYFDADFALSGGEDYVFFRQLHEKGFRLHWSTRAIAYENVPRSRADLDWVRHRMMLKGNIQIRMFRLYEPGPWQEVWRLTKTVGLLATGAIRYAVGLIHPPTRLRAATALWRGVGRIQGHLGHTLTRPNHIEGT